MKKNNAEVATALSETWSLPYKAYTPKYPKFNVKEHKTLRSDKYPDFVARSVRRKHDVIEDAKKDAAPKSAIRGSVM